MSEVRPQFTYTPEGILTVSRGAIEAAETPGATCGVTARLDKGLEERRDRAADYLGGLPGVQIIESSTPQVIIPVHETLEEAIAHKDDGELEEFLACLSTLFPRRRTQDGIDRVLTCPRLDAHGIRADVYEHFQRWLNNSGITEPVSRDCLLAMATAYKREDDVTANFTYYEHDGFASGRAGGLEVAERLEPFGFEKYFKRWGSLRKSVGKDRWKWIALEAFGDPGISVDGDTRQKVRYNADDKRLLRMYSHNVDYARQTLGIFLGLGSLAHNASLHTGTKDVFKDVRWSRSSKWPYPIPTKR